MDTALKDLLDKLDDVDFRELHQCLSLADSLRAKAREYNLSVQDFSEKSGLPIDDLKKMFAGSYDWDLRTISIIQSFSQTLASEHAAKIVEPIISFPDYKYSNPSK